MTDRRSESLTSTLWFSTQFGMLLVAGPLFATLVAGLGTAIRITRYQSDPRALATWSLVAAAVASGLLFNWLVAMPNFFAWVWLAFVVAATVVAYCAVTAAVSSLGQSRSSRPSDERWKEAARRDARNSLMAASAVALLVHAVSHQQWEPLAFLLLPVYCVFRAVYDATLTDEVSEHRELVIESLEKASASST